MVVFRLNKGFQKMARVSVSIEFVTICQAGEAVQRLKHIEFDK